MRGACAGSGTTVGAIPQAIFTLTAIIYQLQLLSSFLLIIFLFAHAHDDLKTVSLYTKIPFIKEESELNLLKLKKSFFV